jgi:hypothetical protein
VRFLATLAATAAGLGASAALAAAATGPSYTISFNGSGIEHQLDEQQNIQDSGLCDSAEHIDLTASLAWTTTWTAFRVATRAALAQPSRIAGSSVSGNDVKDACGLPLEQAPQGWVAQHPCSADLVPAGSPSLGVASKSAKWLVLALAAPPVAAPVGVGCGLNIRNDQLIAHVAVPLKKLNALKKRASLALPVGTAHPGPGDLYAPTLDCSQPTKPYEGYRTADHCQDSFSWSGTVTITRVS